jgi:hypothetical protein
MFFCPYGTVVKSEEEFKQFASKRNHAEISVGRFEPRTKGIYASMVDIITRGFSGLHYTTYSVHCKQTDDGYEVVKVYKLH